MSLTGALRARSLTRKLTESIDDQLSYLPTVLEMSNHSWWIANQLNGDFQTIDNQGLSAAGVATLGSTSGADSNDPVYLPWVDPTQTDVTVDGVGYRYVTDNLVTNGTFDADATGWTGGSGATLASVNGELEVTEATGLGYGYQAVTTKAGSHYRLTADIVSLSVGSSITVGVSAGASTLYNSGTKLEAYSVDTVFTATTTTSYINLTKVFIGDPSYFDNVVVREVAVGAGPQYVYLDGASGSYISQADEAGNSITGDIDLRVKMALDDWTPAANSNFLSKWDAIPDYGFAWQVTTSGTLRFYWSEDGTATQNVISSSAVPFIDGEVGWVRLTVDVDNGSSDSDFKFYTSTDGVAWTQLGTTQNSGAATSFHDSPEVLAIGANSDGDSGMSKGKFYEAQIRNGIDGTIVSHWKASEMGDSSGPDSAPTPLGDWTLNGNYSVAVPSGDYVFLPGTSGNYISSDDSAATSVTGDITLTAKVALDDWTPSSTNALFSKYLGSGNQRSFRLQVDSTGTPNFLWTTDGSAATQTQLNSTADPTVIDGEILWIRLTFDVDNGASGADAKFYTSTDGESWTQLGSTVTHGSTTSIFDGTAKVEIGSYNTGTGDPATGDFYYATIHDSDIGSTAVSAQPDPVWEFDASLITAQSGYTDAFSGDDIDINRSSSGLKTTVVTRDTLLLNSAAATYAEVADHADLDIGAGDSFTAWVYGRYHSAPGGTVVLICTQPTANGSGTGFTLGHNATQGQWYIGDGATNSNDRYTTPSFDSSANLFSGVRRVSEDNIEAFENGTGSGSPSTDTTTATLASSDPLRLGTDNNLGQHPDAEVLAWGVLKGTALTSALLTELKDELDDLLGGRNVN